MGRACLVIAVSDAARAAIVAAGWRIVAGDDPIDVVVTGGPVADARRSSTAPLLALAPAGSDSEARAAAFAAGADDVAPNPCGNGELIARLEALYRRRAIIRCGALSIDLLRAEATRDGVVLGLRAREYGLLRHLAEADGRPVDRAALLQAVWGLAADPGTNVVEVHISRLRRALDRGRPAPLLHTVPGHGYLLAAHPATD